MKIAVVGAGSAGLSAALFLSRAGHATEVIERFDNAAPVVSGTLVDPFVAVGFSECDWPRNAVPQPS